MFCAVRYPVGMAATSPTAEGFRIALRRPSLTAAEIVWRWSVGASAIAVLMYGLVEYLDTLPVTSGELLLLRTRQPYFVGQAIAHILRGSLSRAVATALLGALMLILLWMIAASFGRIATVRALLKGYAGRVAGAKTLGQEASATAKQSTTNFSALLRINFLRVMVALAAILGIAGAVILSGFVSPDANPQPGLAFLVFMPLAALILLVGWALNWFLSLAAIFAVRGDGDALDAISAACSLCRDRAGGVFAVSIWTALAHIGVFVAAITLASVPLGLAGVLPWRIAVLGMIFVALAYFAVADWLYMVRLAGYVCLGEMPEELYRVVPPNPLPPPAFSEQAAPVHLLQTTIDRDEPILSDTPNPPLEP